MIRPLLVQEGKKHAGAGIAWYAAGAVLASALVGAAAGGLGSVFPRSLATHQALCLAAIGVALLGLDLWGKTPTLRRQTVDVWWRLHGLRRATFMWGFDLGLGFTTIRLGSLYWLALAGAAFVGDPLRGAALMSCYGVALVLNLLFGVLVLPRLSPGRRPNLRMLDFAPQLGLALTVGLAAWTLLLIWIGLA